MDKNEKLVAVYSASTPGEADVARILLEEEGIAASVTNASLHGIHGFASVGAHALPNVLVAERDVERARGVLSGISTQGGFLSPSTMHAEPDEPSIRRAPLTAWPQCPSCERPRTTVCPICGTSGSKFPRADENFGEDEDSDAEDTHGAEDKGEELREVRLGLICTTCDEPWRARFLKRCEWCNHDFGQGLNYDPAPQHVEPLTPPNFRTLLATGIIIGALGLLLGWFWLIAQR